MTEVDGAPDRIEREVSVSAPIERVWEVLTEPRHFGVWFGPGEGGGPGASSVDLRPGGVMVLDHGQYGVFPTLITAVEVPTYFAYRWASGHPGEQAGPDNSTLVEFWLRADGDQTVVTVVETGFAAVTVPAERADQASYESHAGGWTEIVQSLATYAEKQV